MIIMIIIITKTMIMKPLRRMLDADRVETTEMKILIMNIN